LSQKRVDQVTIRPSKLASKTSDQENLPDYLTKEVRKEIYKKYEEAFNSRDYDSLWNLFSDLAKSRMNKNEIDKSHDKLLDMFGEVSNGVFTYYEFLGRQGNLRTFVLHYNIDLPESKFGNRGELKITIPDDGTEYGIFGSNMQAM